MPESYFSHDVVTRSDAQRREGAAALAFLRSDPPGAATDNRWNQVQHFRGVVYVAIECVMSLVRGSTYEVLKRKKRKGNRTTFAGKTVVKALPTSQAQGQDEDYVPLGDGDHPLCRMVTHPNCSETFGELSAKLVMQNRLTGVGPVWAVPNVRGRPVELWSLKTPHLWPLYQHTREYPHGAWRVQPTVPTGWAGPLPGGISMAGATLPGEEVKRFLAPHPYLDWDGFSPLTAGARELDVLDAIEESRKSAMDNGLQLDAAYIAPGMSQAEVDALQKKVTEKMGGSRNARRFFVLSPPGGGAPGDKPALQTFGMSPREMDYQQGWEQSVKFCLALFGVPASIANLSNDTSYSERYAARQQFHDSQEDYLTCLGNFYTRVLAWPWCSFPGEYLVRVRPRPINDKELREKQFARQLQYDLLTYNEARAKDDMPPVAGGDVPASLYVEQKKQELMPQPEPAVPGGGMPGAGGEEQGTDPLAELLGTAPGPTAGAAPQPDNPMGAGSLPPRVGKAGTGQHRKEGEKWQGESGKWFTLKQGHVVPAAGGSTPDAPAGSDRKSARAAAAKTLQALAAGEALTPEAETQVRAAFPHMTDQERAAVEKRLARHDASARADAMWNHDQQLFDLRDQIYAIPHESDSVTELENALLKQIPNSPRHVLAHHQELGETARAAMREIQEPGVVPPEHLGKLQALLRKVIVETDKTTGMHSAHQEAMRKVRGSKSMTSLVGSAGGFLVPTGTGKRKRRGKMGRRMVLKALAELEG